MKTAVSVIKAGLGSHARAHFDIINKEKEKTIHEFCAINYRDGLKSVMSSEKGENGEEVHGLARNIFEKAEKKRCH